MGCYCDKELQHEQLNEVDLVKVSEQDELKMSDIQDIIEANESEEHEQPPQKIEEIKVEEIKLRVDEEPAQPQPQQ